jgi:ABC-type transporter Mla subunit MlaD
MLLSDKNSENFSQTLANLKVMSQQMSDYQNKIDTLLGNSIQTGKNMDDMMARVGRSSDTVNDSMATFKVTMSDKFGPTMVAWRETSKNVDTLTKTINANLARGDYDAQASMVELNTLMIQSRTLLGEMELTLKTLKQNPSDLLFKETKPIPGPGENL